MNGLQRALHLGFLVMICSAVAGCGGGEKRVTVTGKIVDGGQPLALQGPDYEEGRAGLEVRFHPLDDAGNPTKGQSFGTRADTGGSFVMDGDGTGIPVGKYRVVLRHQAASGPSGYSPKSRNQGDLFGGKFDINNSPLEYDIQKDEDLTIDIAQGAAAKP